MEDRNKAMEAFRKGDFDVFPVYTASIWAEKTNLDEVKRGWVARHRVYNQEPKGFQGFALNLRRGIFQDERVRRALCHLFNRKLMNDKLMYNEYFLLNSYYPDLHPGNTNPDVPACEYDPEKARTLLGESGWNAGSDGVLIRDGARFEIVFSTSMTDLRHHNVYLEDLKKAGIAARIEQMSQSTLSRNVDRHDFDIFWTAWGASRLRDPESVWHSNGADQNGSNNHPGIKDAFIDSLIQVQKTEMDLGKRNALLRRLDSRLLEIQPYVLMWQSDHSRLLYWRKFGMPKHILDKFGREDAIIPYWFVDPAKEKALAEAQERKAGLAVDTGDVRYAD
jgi:microcin C transport system substrate-binding protein